MEVVVYKLPNKFPNINLLLNYFESKGHDTVIIHNDLFNKYLYKILFRYRNKVFHTHIVSQTQLAHPIKEMFIEGRQKSLNKDFKVYPLIDESMNDLVRYSHMLPIQKIPVFDDFEESFIGNNFLNVLNMEIINILKNMYSFGPNISRYYDDRVGLNILKLFRNISNQDDINNVVIKSNVFNEVVVQLYKGFEKVVDYYFDLTLIS